MICTLKDWNQRYETMIDRYRFLSSVDREIPRVLKDLEQTIYPLFQDFFYRTPRGVPGEHMHVMPDGMSVYNLASG